MRLFRRLLLATVALLLAAGPVLSAATVPLGAVSWTMPLAPGFADEGTITLLGVGLAVVGMIRIRDTATLAGKYVTRAGQAVGDYKAGVEGAGGDWEAGAKAGEANYEAGVQEAIGRKRYGKGIASAGAGKYVKNAANLGAQRYVPGVNNAKDAWATGVQPALDMLKSLNLPPKGPRRSPANQARANMVALELGKLKDRG